MKKLNILTILAAGIIMFGSATFAGFTGPSNASKTTVDKAKNMPDETMVIIEGSITKNLGDDMYIFTDSTGDITVEIDDDDWNGINVGVNDVIIITGEIDKNGDIVEIDVDEVALANQ